MCTQERARILLFLFYFRKQHFIVLPACTLERAYAQKCIYLYVPHVLEVRWIINCGPKWVFYWRLPFRVIGKWIMVLLLVAFLPLVIFHYALRAHTHTQKIYANDIRSSGFQLLFELLCHIENCEMNPFKYNLFFIVQSMNIFHIWF